MNQNYKCKQIKIVVDFWSIFFMLIFWSCISHTKLHRIYSSYTKWYKYVWKVFAGQKKYQKGRTCGCFGWNNLNRKHKKSDI